MCETKVHHSSQAMAKKFSISSHSSAWKKREAVYFSKIAYYHAFQ